MKLTPEQVSDSNELQNIASHGLTIAAESGNHHRDAVVHSSLSANRSPPGWVTERTIPQIGCRRKSKDRSTKYPMGFSTEGRNGVWDPGDVRLLKICFQRARGTWVPMDKTGLEAKGVLQGLL